jgi:hypothetical protein
MTRATASDEYWLRHGAGPLGPNCDLLLEAIGVPRIAIASQPRIADQLGPGSQRPAVRRRLCKEPTCTIGARQRSGEYQWSSTYSAPVAVWVNGVQNAQRCVFVLIGNEAFIMVRIARGFVREFAATGSSDNVDVHVESKYCNAL